MTKKLYLPLLVALVAVLTSCSSKMGELSSDYFTVTPQVLEAVGGKVPATINGKFPEKYFKKKAVVEVTPVLRWEGGEAKGQPAVFQGEKVEGNDQTISYKAGGSYTMKTSFDYVPEMAKSELYLEFKAKVGKKEVTIPAVKVADGVDLLVGSFVDVLNFFVECFSSLQFACTNVSLLNQEHDVCIIFFFDDTLESVVTVSGVSAAQSLAD